MPETWSAHHRRRVFVQSCKHWEHILTLASGNLAQITTVALHIHHSERIFTLQDFSHIISLYKNLSSLKSLYHLQVSLQLPKFSSIAAVSLEEWEAIDPTTLNVTTLIFHAGDLPLATLLPLRLPFLVELSITRYFGVNEGYPEEEYPSREDVLPLVFQRCGNGVKVLALCIESSYVLPANFAASFPSLETFYCEPAYINARDGNEVEEPEESEGGTSTEVGSIMLPPRLNKIVDVSGMDEDYLSSGLIEALASRGHKGPPILLKLLDPWSRVQGISWVPQDWVDVIKRVAERLMDAGVRLEDSNGDLWADYVKPGTK